VKRDNRPVIVTFALAIFILGMLTGAYITDHAHRAQTIEAQEVLTP
jgi:hypothetical protein